MLLSPHGSCRLPYAESKSSVTLSQQEIGRKEGLTSVRSPSPPPCYASFRSSSAAPSQENMINPLPDFVTTYASQFFLGGDAFHVHGFNAYFLMAISSDVQTRFKAVALLQEAANAGLNVARTWAFNDGCYLALQAAPGVYDEKVFQALDFVLDQAHRVGVRLILTLVNNWNEYGGKAKYVEWARMAGVPLEGDDAFFSDPTVKGYYKNHVKAVLTRVNSITGIPYKDDPTIMAWELINEPRCASDPSGDTLQAWIEEMAKFVKSIDHNHLLGLGSEGFYGPSNASRISENPYTYCLQTGTDFLRNHLVDDIDFACAHAYPDSWLGSDSNVLQHISFIENWLAAHIADCKFSLHKPFLLGEFGMSKKENFRPEERETFLRTVYTVLYVTALGGGAISGGLMWQIFPKDLENFNDGYQIVLSEDSSVSRIIVQHAQRIEALTNCRTRTMNSDICPFRMRCW